jgi:DNA-binding NarL/FixJ family response regulator
MIEDDYASSCRVRALLSQPPAKNAELRQSQASSATDTAQFSLSWHARSCAEAKLYVQQGAAKIDIVLLDLGLPDGRGVDLIPLLQQRWRDCVVVAFTVFGDQTTVLEAIEAGVDGYLLKSAQADELSHTLVSAAKGESPISSAVAGFLLRRLRKSEASLANTGPAQINLLSQNQVDSKKDIMTLTAREHDVLESLARGYSYRETAQRLGMSQNTVAHHVKNLYPKLISTSRSEAVFRAVQEGIIKLN